MKNIISPLSLRLLSALFILTSMSQALEAKWHSFISSPLKKVIYLTCYLAKGKNDAAYGAETKQYDPNFTLDPALAAQSLKKGLEQQVTPKTNTRTKTKKRYAKPLPVYRKPAVGPQSFLFGASTSDHQCSNVCTPELCSYTRWAIKTGLPLQDATSTMNLWDNYKSYIDYAKNELNLNSLRFSVEWALVQPTENTFDNAVLDHYADQFVYMIQQGMTPIVCLHHYTDPCWFIDKNGFEDAKNLPLFARFCGKVYQALITRLDESINNGSISQEALETFKSRPPLFATFNSPEGYAFKGYKEGGLPPSNPKKSGVSWATTVLGRLMQAHVKAYAEINKVFAATNKNAWLKKPLVGFLKNITQVDPAPTQLPCGIKLPAGAAKVVCNIAQLVQSDCIYEFFTTGTFNVGPLGTTITDKNAPKSLDFIGLNYYSNRHIDLKTKKIAENTTIATDNDNYSIYPEGMYRAIAELSTRLARPLNIPIYVTENGIATTDDARRNSFYQSYLNELIRAVNDGYDVRGYLTWTLADNYEWPKKEVSAKRRRYGLCTTSTDGKTITKKPGAEFYCTLAKEFKAIVGKR